MLQILTVGICNAQDILSNQQHNSSNQIISNAFLNNNAAVIPYLDYKNIADFEISADIIDGELGVLENGTSIQKLNIKIGSIKNLTENDISWGGMSYQSGVKDNVMMNESSDYDMVYPYVMCDTLGGDDMKFEIYSFNLGYARRLSRFTVGGEFDYRAQKGYRAIDPRPNNTTSHLILKLGSTYALNNKYAVGIGGEYELYKQSNSLTFHSEVSNPRIVQLQGLGSENTMLSSKYSTYLFDGMRYGANLSYFSTEKKGIKAQFAYKKYHLEKQLPEQLYLTVNDVYEDMLSGTIAYQFEDGYFSSAIKLEAQHKIRKGIEYRFNLSDSNIYDVVSSSQKYNHSYQDMALSGYLERDLNKRFNLSIEPSIGLVNSIEENYSYNRELSYTQLYETLSVKAKYSTDKSIFIVKPSISASQNLSKNLDLDGLYSWQTSYQVITSNYNYYTLNSFKYMLSVEYLQQINSKISTKLSINGYYTNFAPVTVGESQFRNKGGAVSLALLF